VFVAPVQGYWQLPLQVRAPGLGAISNKGSLVTMSDSIPGDGVGDWRGARDCGVGPILELGAGKSIDMSSSGDVLGAGIVHSAI
jgi:hypothetical protein